MRLYPKRLRSMASLKQEKKKLLKEKQALDEEDIFSLGALLGSGGDAEDGGGIAGRVLGFIQGSNPVAGMVANLVKSRLGKRKKKRDDDDDDNPPSGKERSKNYLAMAAREFIGGYLKWKAIELSYKGIKYVIKKQRSKKADY